FVFIMLFNNSYKIIEKIIIGFVSIIGLSFLYELTLVNIDWAQAGIHWIKPEIPKGSVIFVMSLLGAVIMPHNLFLHSEIIQSRQWNLENEKAIKKQLDYEFCDTLFSMVIGWAINSAMILLAATTFFQKGINVNELSQAHSMLEPLLGNHAAGIFAIALLFSGVASTITSGMAGGSIFAGFFGEPYDIKDNHSRLGIALSLVLAFFILLMIGNTFKALIISQMVLCLQLPFTIFLQIYLTSSKKVMGNYANVPTTKAVLLLLGGSVSILNILLLVYLMKM
ncbi:MAG: Nramp family divalent metal transporter, partial [Bacteroidota bacterium]|nr:Nramp family divalent metal transporter [Bacteroidota bacterium]